MVDLGKVLLILSTTSCLISFAFAAGDDDYWDYNNLNYGGHNITWQTPATNEAPDYLPEIPHNIAQITAQLAGSTIDVPFNQQQENIGSQQNIPGHENIPYPNMYPSSQQYPRDSSYNDQFYFHQDQPFSLLPAPNEFGQFLGDSSSMNEQGHFDQQQQDFSSFFNPQATSQHYLGDSSNNQQTYNAHESFQGLLGDSSNNEQGYSDHQQQFPQGSQPASQTFVGESSNNKESTEPFTQDANAAFYQLALADLKKKESREKSDSNFHQLQQLQPSSSPYYPQTSSEQYFGDSSNPGLQSLDYVDPRFFSSLPNPQSSQARSRTFVGESSNNEESSVEDANTAFYLAALRALKKEKAGKNKKAGKKPVSDIHMETPFMGDARRVRNRPVQISDQVSESSYPGQNDPSHFTSSSILPGPSRLASSSNPPLSTDNADYEDELFRAQLSANGDCFLSLKTLPDRHAIPMTIDQLAYPSYKDYIVIPNGNSLYFSCTLSSYLKLQEDNQHGSANNINLHCNNGSLMTDEEQTLSPDELECLGLPEIKVRLVQHTDTCGIYTHYRLVFTDDMWERVLYDFCVDRNENDRTVFTWTQMDKKIQAREKFYIYHDGYIRPKTGVRSKDHIKTASEPAYRMESLRVNLTHQLGEGDTDLGIDLYDELTANNKILVTKGHLASSLDFVFRAEQLGTRHFANVLPMWSTLKVYWEIIEIAVSQLTRRKSQPITIFTGSSGRQSVKNYNGNTINLFLYQNKREKMTYFPEYFWKVVIDTEMNQCVTILGSNDPKGFTQQNLDTFGGSANVEWLPSEQLDAKYCYAVWCYQFLPEELTPTLDIILGSSVEPV